MTALSIATSTDQVTIPTVGIALLVVTSTVKLAVPVVVAPPVPVVAPPLPVVAPPMPVDPPELPPVLAAPPLPDEDDAFAPQADANIARPMAPTTAGETRNGVERMPGLPC
jgi:hypothetical protein